MHNHDPWRPLRFRLRLFAMAPVAILFGAAYLAFAIPYWFARLSLSFFEGGEWLTVEEAARVLKDGDD